ncbi:hypothetical protein ACQP04_24595 [Pseudonocardia halophobica]|uniref:hypothetical protein n=1 Tax=Pseudonocardia halophobica TaxID=29401 RepID=UPI003D8CF8A9
MGGPDEGSLRLVDVYPHSLLVFGGDLGHAGHPAPADIVPQWMRSLEERAGAKDAAAITTRTTQQLLLQ